MGAPAATRATTSRSTAGKQNKEKAQPNTQKAHLVRVHGVQLALRLGRLALRGLQLEQVAQLLRKAQSKVKHGNVTQRESAECWSKVQSGAGCWRA